MNRKQNLLRNLQELGRIQPAATDTKRAIEQARAAMSQSEHFETRESGFRFVRVLAPLTAAAVILILAVHWNSTGTNNIAFAQVQQQVAQTKSAQYTENFTDTFPDGKPAPTIITHVKILGNRLKRSESEMKADESAKENPGFLGPWGPSVEIIDLDKKKKVSLYPEIKGYMAMDWKGTFAEAYDLAPEEERKFEEKAAAIRKDLEKNNPELSKQVTGVFVAGEIDWDSRSPNPQLDIYEQIRHVPSDRAKQLDEKIINGQRVVGFLIEQDDKRHKTHWQHTWWVDPSTKLPVQLEISWHGNDSQNTTKKIVSDIVFNVPMDLALFRVDPPGYTDLGPESIRASQRKYDPQAPNSLQYTQIETLQPKDGKQAPKLRKQVTILDRSWREEVTLEPAANSEGAHDLGIQPHIRIHDSPLHKMMVLLPDKKEAFADSGNSNLIDDYAQLVNQSVLGPTLTKFNPYDALLITSGTITLLPLRTIDDHLVYGRKVDEKIEQNGKTGLWQRTQWVDVFYPHPVQVEAKFHSDDPNIADTEWTISNVEEGKPVDRALFSLDLPAGYTKLAEDAKPDAATEAAIPEKTEFVFEEVQKEVEKAKTVQYIEVRKDSDKSSDFKSETRSKVMVLAPAIERREVTHKVEKLPKGAMSGIPEGSYIMINDMRRGKLITLFPDEKSYSVPTEVLSVDPDMQVQGSKIKPEPKVDIYNQLREVQFDKAQRLPEKLVDGRKAIGFLIEEKRETKTGVDTSRRTYWVDPKTKLPIRLEATSRSTKPFMGDTDWVLSDFVFDAPLDPALFSTDPPEGYTKLTDQRRTPAANEHKPAPDDKNQQQPTPTKGLR